MSYRGHFWRAKPDPLAELIAQRALLLARLQAIEERIIQKGGRREQLGQLQNEGWGSRAPAKLHNVEPGEKFKP